MGEDVDLLVQQLYQGQDEDDETLMVDADEVLNLLKKYQEEKENLAAQVVAPDKKKKKSSGKALGSESEAERKLRRRKEEKKFWERIAHVIPEMNTRVWKALDRFLAKYYELLQRRAGARGVLAPRRATFRHCALRGSEGSGNRSDP